MNFRTLIAVGVLAGLPMAAGAQSPESKSGSDIDLAELVEKVARRSGKQVIIDPRVRAQVPLANLDPNKITYEDLLAILSVHMFAAVKVGDRIIVVPDANARQLPTPVYTDRNFKAMPDELVTLVLKVKNGCAPQMVPVLRPLMPQSAHMAAYPDSNVMILSDHAANLHRIVEVIEAIERNSAEGRGCGDVAVDRTEKK